MSDGVVIKVDRGLPTAGIGPNKIFGTDSEGVPGWRTSEGATGRGIETVTLTDNNLVFNFDDGTSSEPLALPVDAGADDSGPTATFAEASGTYTIEPGYDLVTLALVGPTTVYLRQGEPGTVVTLHITIGAEFLSWGALTEGETITAYGAEGLEGEQWFSLVRESGGWSVLSGKSAETDMSVTVPIVPVESRPLNGMTPEEWDEIAAASPYPDIRTAKISTDPERPWLNDGFSPDVTLPPGFIWNEQLLRMEPWDPQYISDTAWQPNPEANLTSVQWADDWWSGEFKHLAIGSDAWTLYRRTEQRDVNEVISGSLVLYDLDNANEKKAYYFGGVDPMSIGPDNAYDDRTPPTPLGGVSDAIKAVARVANESYFGVNRLLSSSGNPPLRPLPVYIDSVAHDRDHPYVKTDNLDSSGKSLSAPTPTYSYLHLDSVTGAVSLNTHVHTYAAYLDHVGPDLNPAYVGKENRTFSLPLEDGGVISDPPASWESTWTDFRANNIGGDWEPAQA